MARVRSSTVGGSRDDVRRYTIDASVFVNAFNPYEAGHAASLEVLATIQGRGDPIVVPTLIVPEIACAVARATDDTTGALQYAQAAAALPHLTVVSLTPSLARQAADMASMHRLRGADAVYVCVARRFGTLLVTRDQEQLSRAAAVGGCLTPDDALTPPRPPRLTRRRTIGN